MDGYNIIDRYIDYIGTVRRYSDRTVVIYRESLEMFASFSEDTDNLAENLTSSMIRRYEIYLLETKGMAPKTVNLHISILSGFCKFLLKQGIIDSNPARSVTRPKMGKRLPDFYKKESLDEYFKDTSCFIDKDLIYCSTDEKTTRNLYEKRLCRAIVSTLYNTGIRRSELIGMKIGDMDFNRKTARIHGKGDKMREIPVVTSLCEELLLYLQAVETMVGGDRGASAPLFVTFSGRALYPVYVDKAIKKELGEVAGITGKKSPHVLRHTLATELLNKGTDLNSIKELLGHSSLAATQVYTHNSIAKLKKIYETAHPRASKNGGKNGD